MADKQLAHSFYVPHNRDVADYAIKMAELAIVIQGCDLLCYAIGDIENGLFYLNKSRVDEALNDEIIPTRFQEKDPK